MVNNTILVGNVGTVNFKDLGNDTTVTNFSVATQEYIGQGKNRTTWHDCAAWGKLSEIVRDRIPVGSQVYVDGSTTYNEYTDKSGVKHRRAQIRVQNIRIIKRPGDKQDDATSTEPTGDSKPVI